MENCVSMYHPAPPMPKEASFVSTPLFSRGSNTAKNYFSRQLGRLVGYAQKNPAVVSGAGLGLLGGTWLGNKAYEVQIPPVRALPRLEQRPMIDPYYQNQ